MLGRHADLPMPSRYDKSTIKLIARYAKGNELNGGNSTILREFSAISHCTTAKSLGTSEGISLYLIALQQHYTIFS